MNIKYLLFSLLVILLSSCTPVASSPLESIITSANPTAIKTEQPTPTTKVIVVHVTSTHEPTDTPTHTLTNTPTLTLIPTRTTDPSLVEWSGDLHVHTTCSGGESTYDELIQKTLNIGFEFIAITDYVGFYQKSCQESNQKCREETRLLCIPGSEEAIGGQRHIIALGINESIIDKQSINFNHQKLKDRIKKYHDQGGLAIAAHPELDYSEEQLLYSGFDGMECSRGMEGYNQWQLEMSEKLNLPCVYSSDAHGVDKLGSRYTVCTIPINSLSDLNEALMAGKCHESSIN